MPLSWEVQRSVQLGIFGIGWHAVWGTSGGKGHYQRDEREGESPVFFSFKKSFKKEEFLKRQSNLS